MADAPYAGKIKNQGTQEVRGPYAKKGTGGKAETHKGGDLRSKG